MRKTTVLTWIALIALSAVPGCRATRGPKLAAAEPQVQPSQEVAVEADAPPEAVGDVSMAKTIDWPDTATLEGATYLRETVSVEEIFREDAADQFGARVRLRNLTDQNLRLEYRFRFVTPDGHALTGYAGAIGDKEHWTPFVMDPFGAAVVEDACRIHGAVAFHLLLRGVGEGGDGSSDRAALVPRR